MEESELRDGAPDPAPAPASADGRAREDVLREELTKWRERVPKLAAALRQRTEENSALKAELERLRSMQSAGHGTAAGIRAREELIGELERKLRDLAERHKTAEGELYKRQLEVDEHKGEVEAWKAKWQAVTRALDSQAAEETGREQHFAGLEESNVELCRRMSEAESAQKERERVLEEVTEERDSLRLRNEQLFETTELANRQIGALTDSLAELRMQLKQHREHQALLEARLNSVSAAGGEAETAVIHLTEELHLMSLAVAGAIRAGAEAETRAIQAERARQELSERLLAMESRSAQELADALGRNEELLGHVRQLEAELAAQGAPAIPTGDDLTRIHGVGHRLAEQLNELGIRHYRQIAELNETQLADESHVLHGHRGRIIRDGWIEQAVRLTSH